MAFNEDSNYETISQNQKGFMHWFLNVEEQINELANQWRGYVQDIKTGEWKEADDSEELRTMNEKGIRWSIQFLKSFVGRANQGSAYNDAYVNFIMREYVSNTVLCMLQDHYFDYGFKKASDVQSVSSQICNLCLTVLNGARANGYRTFLTQTHQVQEVKTLNETQQNKGFFSALGSVFKRPPSPQEQMYIQGG